MGRLCAVDHVSHQLAAFAVGVSVGRHWARVRSNREKISFSRTAKRNIGTTIYILYTPHFTRASPAHLTSVARNTFHSSNASSQDSDETRNVPTKASQIVNTVGIIDGQDGKHTGHDAGTEDGKHMTGNIQGATQGYTGREAHTTSKGPGREPHSTHHTWAGRDAHMDTL